MDDLVKAYKYFQAAEKIDMTELPETYSFLIKA